MTNLISRKTLGFILATVMLLILATTSNTTAYGASISSYSSCFQVVNLDASGAANIMMTFYKQDGTVEASVSDSVPSSGSNTYCPLPAGVGAGFNGSAVISADKQIAAIANLLGDATQNSSYSGFESGSNVVSLPLIQKDYFDIDTWFNVQNAGSAATSVTVSYAGTSCTETATIQPGAAATFDQATNTCLPSDYVNSATVTAGSGGSIVASALQVASIGLFNYNGFPAGSPSAVMPLVQYNNFGYHSGVQIQNQGTSATNVTVSYNPATAGTACTETKSIAAGASETFGLFAFSYSGTTSSTCTFGQQFVGSATVSANSASEPLVAIVNQSEFSKFGSAYNGFDPSSATSTVTMPLIMDAYGYWTGYNVMNVGTATTSVTCSYDGLASSFNVTQTLAPGSAISSVQFNSGFPANTGGGYVGSGTCVGGSGSQLVGVVNQLQTVAAGDGLLTHEAANQ